MIYRYGQMRAKGRCTVCAASYKELLTVNNPPRRAAPAHLVTAEPTAAAAAIASMLRLVQKLSKPMVGQVYGGA